MSGSAVVGGEARRKPRRPRLLGPLMRVTGATLFARMTTAVIGFSTIPLLVTVLGRENYGIYVTVVSLAVFLTFADQGLAVSVRTRVAEAVATDRNQEVPRIVAGGVRLMLCVAAGLVAATIVLSAFDPWAPVVGEEAGLGVELYLIAMSLGVLAAVPLRALEGLGKASVVAAVPVLGSGWLLVGALLALKFGWGITTLLVITGLINLLPLFLAALVLAHAMKPFGRRVGHVRGRSLWGGSWPMAVVSIMLTLSYSVDPLIISSVLTHADTADYAVAAKLYQFVLMLLLAGAPVLWTHFASQRALEGLVTSEIVKRSLTMTFVGVILAAVLLLCGPWAVRLWVGEEFSGSGGVLVAFAALLVVLSAQVVPGMALTDDASLRFQAATTTAMAAANVPASIVLAGELGPEGPVWASAGCLALFHAVPMWWRVIRRRSGLP